MDIRSKIAEAWQITQLNPKLKFFSFFPALISTLVGAVWLIYQYVTLSPILFDYKSDLIDQAIQIAYDGGQWSVAFAAVSFVVFLSYLSLPTLFHGGLIQMIDRIRQDKKISYFQGFSQGLIVYPQVFEFHTMISPLSVISVFSVSAWALRGGIEGFWPIALFLMFIAFVMSFFFSYVDFFIVLKRQRVFSAIAKSTTMVTLHLPETAFMIVLMAIIGVRIIINIVLILMIPIVIIIVAAYLSTLAIGSSALIIGLSVIFSLTILVSYLNAIVNVFTTAVWVITFDHLVHESKDILDV